MAENNQKKYVSSSRLSLFLDNLKTIFSPLVHTHKITDISDYTVDTELSSTSSNPVQNKVLDAEFEAVSTAINALDSILDDKMDKNLGADKAGKILVINDDGDIIAGNPTIEGAVDAAAKLSTPREIALNGDAIGSAMFDGSQNISIETEIPELDVDVVTNVDYENDLAFDTNEIVSSIAIPVGSIDGELLEYDNMSGCYSTTININMPLVSGNTYTVIWDGKAYNCTARDCSAYIIMNDNRYDMTMSNAIGNSHIVTKIFSMSPITHNNQPTTEPFAMNNHDNSSTIYIYSADAGPHTIRIYQ